jgi:hypothetical protein
MLFNQRDPANAAKSSGLEKQVQDTFLPLPHPHSLLQRGYVNLSDVDNIGF